MVHWCLKRETEGMYQSIYFEIFYPIRGGILRIYNSYFLPKNARQESFFKNSDTMNEILQVTVNIEQKYLSGECIWMYLISSTDRHDAYFLTRMR